MAEANDAIVAEFQNITGCDTERARFYLESANMQLDLAISSFFENDGMEVAEPVEDISPASHQGQEPGIPGAAAGADAALSATAGGVARPAAGRINFSGMGGGDDSSEEEEEDGQAFYAGGSTSSGNVILGPGKKKRDDIVGSLFKAARDAGAEEVAEPGTSTSRTRVKAFTGGGFKLGSESQPSVAVGLPAGPAAPAPRKFILKMWQNGFSVDDGELREYTSPESREFLQAVMRGSIPAELVREARGGEVHVDMEDHRNEEFSRPKTVRKAFQGSGQVLGSIAPQVATAVPTASAAVDPAQAEAAAKQKVGLDEAQPTSNIQVRMADGSRLIARLNHTHTVGDLRAYITTARPQYASVPFALLNTFPPTELTEETKTLKEAGLLGAAVLQRLK